MAVARLHTLCCEIDAGVAEEELEWLSRLKRCIWTYCTSWSRVSFSISHTPTSFSHYVWEPRAHMQTQTHPAAVSLQRAPQHAAAAILAC